MKPELDMSQAATTDLIDAWRLEIEGTSPTEHAAIYETGRAFLTFMEQELAGSRIPLRSDAAWATLEHLTQADSSQVGLLQDMIIDNQLEPVDDRIVLKGFSILNLVLDNGAEHEVPTIPLVATGVAPIYPPARQRDHDFTCMTHMLLTCHELMHVLIKLDEYNLELREAVCDYYVSKFFRQPNQQVIFRYELDEVEALRLMKTNDIAMEIPSRNYWANSSLVLRRTGDQWLLIVDALKYYLDATYEVKGHTYSRLVHTQKFERLEKRFGPKVLEALKDPNHAKPAYQRWLIRYLLTAAFFNQAEQRA